jgi:3-dehydroquinate synthetase
MTGSPHERRIRVELGARSYDVVIGTGLLPNAGALIDAAAGPLRGRKVFIAVDDALPGTLISALMEALGASGTHIHREFVKAEEGNKSLARAEELFTSLSGAGFDRRDLLVALGGGIVGDLGGFVAGTYHRGISWVQCPTTLLSMVDASVGGKTAVNLILDPFEGDFRSTPEIRKNIIGVVHQPRLVLADVSALASLSERSFRAGLAECIKHGLLAEAWGIAGLFAWTEQHLDSILRRDEATLIELIFRNVAVKARVVEADEREEISQGLRAQLNLGHTFGHAFESLPKLSPDGHSYNAPLQHGEAVALGLVAASRCAAAAGVCPTAIAEKLELLLSRAGLPVRIGGLPPNQTVIARMMHDKKVAAGRLRLVLPESIGRCTFRDDISLAAIEAGIDAVRKT